MTNGDGNGDAAGTKYLGWRIFSGALVVVVGLAAVVISLGLLLDTYEVNEVTPAPATSTVEGTQTTSNTTATTANEPGSAPTSGSPDGSSTNPNPPTPPSPPATTADTVPLTDTASVSASSIVAILTPVIAGIVGIAGLFFGISATGSARGREAEAEVVKASQEAGQH